MQGDESCSFVSIQGGVEFAQQLGWMGVSA